ncbi:MAG: hypothetical protein LBK94_09995 [Prevotellaceae bacterium]|jgi:hypothetical protein|nr:hypothetical protein [Prevotellaceae bacterium]
MIRKDKTIIAFIKKIKTDISLNSLETVDYWDADMCAIGLKKDNKLVYISTYNYVNAKIIKYDFDFEIIDNINYETIKIIKNGINISESELISEIKLFLCI